MSRFERRFEGPNNAGLRTEIRRIAASAAESGEPVGYTIYRCIRRTVALTASGLAILDDVAADYATANGESSYEMRRSAAEEES